MKLLRHSLRLAILAIAVAVLPSGCARFASQQRSLAWRGTNFDERTLADPALKRFIEANLKRRLEPWPPESWDLPKLTLAAQYFRTSAEKSATGQVRANVRTNLLQHLGAQRRLELLNAHSEIQSEIIRCGRNRRSEGVISWEKLSAVHIRYAETLMARLDALERSMQSRILLAEAVGVPVRALLRVELSYDFSRGTTNEFTAADLRRLAVQSRSTAVNSQIERHIAAHRAAQKELARRLACLSARQRKRNFLAAQAGDGTEASVELLLLDARVAAARLAVFDAQVELQHALGALEDAVQQPAELFPVIRPKGELVSAHE